MATHTAISLDGEADAADLLSSARSASRRFAQVSERLEGLDLNNVDKVELAETFAELRAAEKAAENIRKEMIGDELEDRMDEGETIDTPVARATRVSSYNRYVKDGEAARESVNRAAVESYGEEIAKDAETALKEVADKHGLNTEDIDGINVVASSGMLPEDMPNSKDVTKVKSNALVKIAEEYDLPEILEHVDKSEYTYLRVSRH